MKFNEGPKNPSEFGRKNAEEIKALLQNREAIRTAQEQGNGTPEDNVRLKQIEEQLRELGYSSPNT